MKVVRTRPAPNFTVSFKIFKSLCDLRDLCVSQCTTISAPIRLATVFQQNQELEKCTRADTSHLSLLTSHFPSLSLPLSALTSSGTASLPAGGATRPTSSF